MHRLTHESVPQGIVAIGVGDLVKFADHSYEISPHEATSGLDRTCQP